MPSAQPAISVIMPIYNTAPYLRRALDSVCRQTFKDQEILCVDDGSTDESPAILAEYVARDPRIRILAHGKIRGYACAMSSGFEAARGGIPTNLRERMKEGVQSEYWPLLPKPVHQQRWS